MADADAPQSDNHGHRARLRERLLGRGGDALLDHELVEYLLALAIPRRDTKPLAKALLREFGGIGGLLTADAEALGRVPGMGETSAAAIKIAHAAAIRLLQSNVQARPVLANLIQIDRDQDAVVVALVEVRAGDIEDAVGGPGGFGEDQAARKIKAIGRRRPGEILLATASEDPRGNKERERAHIEGAAS